MSSTDLCGGRQAVACIDGGQGDDGPETGPAVDEADISAVIAHDAARNGKPKADTAGFAVTRILHAEERNEDLFGQIGRNSRPVILDDDVDAVLAIRHADPCALSVAHGIFDQIADGA